ncbi:MAG: glucose-1-phosphate thymidylyltransferase [Proteobacteria bacterium]|nr:glucose-1-phosphate thymidylyltransferase [Pseudomonadota bacterium]
MLVPQDFFDVKGFDHPEIFLEDEAVWTALDRLPGYLATFFQKSRPLSNITGQINKALVIYKGEIREDLDVKATGPKNSIKVYRKEEILEDASVILPGAFLFNDQIIIGPGTIVEPGVFLKGPVVIGKDTEIRQGAYIRGDCLVGNRCVIGHTTEMKGSIMLDGAKAAHFAYVGDSILGKEVNLGAGTKLANLKMIPGSITITADKKRYKTGRRKLGAILGDCTETGCNSVTSPGTLIGPHSIIYANVAVPGGYYPKRTFIMPSQGSLRIHSPDA